MTTWTKDSKLEDDDIRVVKFTFMTDKGPGTVTVMVTAGVSIDDAMITLLDQIDNLNLYQTIEITNHEILEVIRDGDEGDLPGAGSTLH